MTKFNTTQKRVKTRLRNINVIVSPCFIEFSVLIAHDLRKRSIFPVNYQSELHQNPSRGSGEEVESVNCLTDVGRTDYGQRMI